MDNHPERRTFMRWALHGMGAMFTVALGAPAVAYLIDPLNRPKPETGFRTVDGVRLADLVVNQPRQGVIRNIRWDAWTVYPSDVVGRVWVVKEANGEIKVFTTVCPHLGCSINLNADPTTGFTCPCHAAKFNLEGEIQSDTSGHANPAPRPMDTLTWRVDPDDPLGQRIQVDYKNYYQGRPTKDVNE